MKNIKDLREQYNLVTEKEENDMNKITQLVRAGLFDAKKLSLLKRAMEKPADKMTAQEKRMMLNLLDSLMAEVLSDKQVYRKVKQDVMKESKILETEKLTKTDIPSVLLLKRKAIRAFPNGQKVGLYYAQAIDKYVTVPFGEIGMQSIQEGIRGTGAVLGLANYVSNSKGDNEENKKELKPLESGKIKLTINSPKEDDEERRRPSAQASRAERLSRLANQAMANNIRENTKESIILGGNLFELNNKEAKKVLSLYESLNKTNKRKMLGMMLESKEGLNRVISFAVRQ